MPLFGKKKAQAAEPETDDSDVDDLLEDLHEDAAVKSAADLWMVLCEYCETNDLTLIGLYHKLDKKRRGKMHCKELQQSMIKFKVSATLSGSLAGSLTRARTRSSRTGMRSTCPPSSVKLTRTMTDRSHFSSFKR